MRLFIPDLILPSQWSNTKDLTPEQEMCLAMLQQAVTELELKATCNSGPRPRDRKISQRRLAFEAYDWIAKENDEYTFSFNNICRWLGLPVDRMKKALLNKYALYQGGDVLALKKR